jgi:flagella basal body P-ring formation protein FlgA
MASFVLAPEHALPEVPRGSSVTLSIRRGSVEVTTPAVVTRDASFGDVVQVTVRSTGRAVRARLEEGGRAILEGEP